eukprot:TRINITY_DN4370_c0_g1_i1.p1 TRINITY_DN4370_c0_g1~~TRINITY_DN4370_c0_g1_i1.p1  ORF type:complete len:175 (+),score=37.48 TRINITY_DN4370_c0_g1_i1:59-583(+)
MMMDNSVDIYSDLQDVQTSNAVLLQEIDALKERVKSLEKEKDTLFKQNEILTRNISCLYRTAVMEVQRKDDEIKLLRDRYEGKRTDPNRSDRERHPSNPSTPREKPKESSSASEPSHRSEETPTDLAKKDPKPKEGAEKERRSVYSDRMDSQFKRDYKQRSSSDRYSASSDKPR